MSDERDPKDPGFPDDAFIDPDEPIVRKGPPTKPEDFEEVVRGRGGADEDEEDETVVVTGIGSQDALDEIRETRRYGDPRVAELVKQVAVFADQLRKQGEAALRVEPDMDRFETSIRAFCTGYLAGRREE